MGMAIVPDGFGAGVREIAPDAGSYFASLLYAGGRCDLSLLGGWMDPERYGREVPDGLREMADRLYAAIDRGYHIVVWSDGSADGMLTAAVLMEGLGWVGDGCISYDVGHQPDVNKDQFVIAYDNAGTPSTGDSNPNFLSLNPYSAAMDGRAGVAIAFGLLEQLKIKTSLITGDWRVGDLSELLDLVTVGLLSDPAIAMTGEHRYLVQRGIPFLQRQEDPKTSTRPGIQRMLEHCKEQGEDRKSVV